MNERISSVTLTGRSTWHSITLRCLAVWVGLAVVAALNGVFRESVLTPALGEAVAHVLSTGMLVVAVVVAATLFVRRYARDAGQWTLLVVGFGWTTLTLAFEFLFGHYVEGKSWSVLLADYDVLAGRVWVLVPLALLLAPALAARYLRSRD